MENQSIPSLQLPRALTLQNHWTWAGLCHFTLRLLLILFPSGLPSPLLCPATCSGSSESQPSLWKPPLTPESNFRRLFSWLSVTHPQGTDWKSLFVGSLLCPPCFRGVLDLPCPGTSNLLSTCMCFSQSLFGTAAITNDHNLVA